MFKKEKVVAIVMATMLGVSGIGGNVIQSDARAMLRSGTRDNTVAHAICKGKKAVIIKGMLNSGADPNSEYLKHSALYYAFDINNEKKRYKVMEMLLKANATFRDDERFFALTDVIANGYSDIEQLLNDHHITFTSEEEREEANKLAKEAMEMSASFESNHHEDIGLNDNDSSVDDSYVLPASYPVSGEEEQGYLDLLRNGAIRDINAKICNLEDDDEGYAGGSTLLMLAAYNGWLQLAKELLESGADITLVNNGNRNAVMLASQMFTLEEKDKRMSRMLQMLRLLHHFRPTEVEDHINDIDIWPNTALLNALKEGANLKIVSLLVNWGANINLDVNDGECSFNSIGAAVHGVCDIDVIEFLLDCGANPDGRYADEALPLEEAYYNYCGNERYAIMQLLLERGVNTAAHDYSDLLAQAIYDEKHRIPALLRRYRVNEPSPEKLETLRRRHEYLNNLVMTFEKEKECRRRGDQLCDEFFLIHNPKKD